MSFKLTIDEGEFLTKLVRQAIVTYLDTSKTIVTPRSTPMKLREKGGVFVTLNKIANGNDELRGCIGFPQPDLPLIDATINAAISAAVHDPRFPPVTSQELKNIKVEVSILTPPKLIEVENQKDYIKEIKIGQCGLIVERGWFKGLLLPQVSVEWKWDVEEFLANCCIKAGLSPDMWLIKGTKIYKFSCIIARELAPNGPVTIVDMQNDDPSKI